MSTEGFTLELLVPAGKVLSEPVSSVSLPAALGQIGILPNHVAYTGLLGTGIMDYAGQSGSKRAVISGGFVNFDGATLQILADTVDTLESVDRAKYGADRAVLEKAVSELDTQIPDWNIAKTKLDRIEAIDRLLAN